MSHVPTTPTHELPAQQRSEADHVRAHRMDDAPMRSKIALIVVAGVFVGILVHLVSTRLHNTDSVTQAMHGFIGHQRNIDCLAYPRHTLDTIC